jgi:NAD(P)H-quinone oxidoreductase subunit 5
MNIESLFPGLGVGVLLCPAILLVLIGLPALARRPLTEKQTNLVTSTSIVIGLLMSLMILAVMLTTGTRHVPIDLGDWVSLPVNEINHVPFHFHLKIVFDRLSVPFVVLTFLLCGTIGLFGSRYLHREPGYSRFFVAYAIFTLGMIVATLAGTIEMLFFGWELVGLSSAMLIAFFHERTGPVKNGFRVWCVYRLADAAFLMAAIAMHHLTGAGDFARLAGEGVWPEGIAKFTSFEALFVGSLLLVAAAGKSALIPFSGWLPRAMEGPTPSSAIFYGALSVHLGAFLLLRASPILECSILISVMVFALGAATAFYASVTSRVQPDIKTVLAFASMTQVGIIVAEIGFAAVLGALSVANWAAMIRYFALIHILGHAGLRTLQLLRAPTLLHDYHNLENAIGNRLENEDVRFRQVTGDRFFRFAFERGGLDSFLDRIFVGPFLKLIKKCHSMEIRWGQFLAGEMGRDPENSSLQNMDSKIKKL